MRDLFDFADDLGPTKIVHVYEPSAGLKGILVVDNVARGPAIGGLRIAPDVSCQECIRLARAMTLKNAAADLPHGGGKSVIRGDPKMPKREKEARIRAMACALRSVEEYIFGPDMGTNEECMAWVRDEIGRAVGLPCEVGGIPLDEIGATGWGVLHSTEVALGYLDLDLDGASVAVQGFGAVGRHAARFLSERGAILVGAADSCGAVSDPHGLDVGSLIDLKGAGKSVVDYPGGTKLNREAVIDVECDIWIPAARPDVIDEENVNRLKTKLVVQGANIPITAGAEKILSEKGILSVPDFIANAGGVICAANEYRGASRSETFSSIEEKIRQNTSAVLEAVRDEGKLPREAAFDLAVSRLKRCMGYRRWSLFSSAPGFL
ncbi:MAG: Glu/Leu/Phe/Val dehydrogenase [Methanothrix sp.]|nr:Glu/Leu/Phe/Val dehydrogenase [Methanothrix sp.]